MLPYFSSFLKSLPVKGPLPFVVLFAPKFKFVGAPMLGVAFRIPDGHTVGSQLRLRAQLLLHSPSPHNSIFLVRFHELMSLEGIVGVVAQTLLTYCPP